MGEALYYLSLLIIPMAIGYWLGHIPGMIQTRQLRKLMEIEDANEVAHPSHILMVGSNAATECINCGGNSKSPDDVNKLVLPCTMELSVYGGNR